MRLSIRSAVSTVAIATAIVLPAVPAVAQDTAAEVETGGLRDIVVTARRVEERLQDVPLSITAFDTQSLADNQIAQVQDLGAQVPNVITGRTSVPGAGQVAIRGVQGQSLPRIGLDNRVGVYLDGVYLARAQGQSFNLADIERIEVLKGPQGTLFGRNVTAGSINIVTAAPKGEFGGKIEGTLGSRNLQRYRATLELPEAGGFSARITYVHEEQEGAIKNLRAGNLVQPFVISVPAQAAQAATATSDAKPASAAFNFTGTPRPAAKTLDANNSESLFVAVRYDGIDGLVADYKFDYTDEITTTPNGFTVGFSPAFGNGCVSAAIALGSNVNNCVAGIAPAAFNPTVPGSGIVSNAPTITNVGGNNGYFIGSGAQNFVFGNRRPDAVAAEFLYGSTIKSMGHNLTLNYEVNDNINLRSISAYRHLKTFSQGDQDSGSYTLNNAALNAVLAASNPLGRPLYPATGTSEYSLGLAYQGQDQKQWSQEFQAYGSATDWLDYLVGLYYFKEKGYSYQFTINSNAGSPSNFNASIRGTNGIPPYNATGINNWGIGAITGGDFTNVSSQSKAVFGRVTIKPFDGLDIVLGGRYTKDNKTGSIPQFVANILDFNPLTANRDQPPTFLRQSFDRFTYDATITYHVTQDINVYGRYATAYLAGGAIRNIPFLPETTKAGEIGLKSELFDRRLRFNAAAFWQKSRNSQFTRVGSFSVLLPGQATNSTITATSLVNLGSVRVRGFEAELTAAPFEGLLMSGSVGYTDQKYTAPAGTVPLRNQAPNWTIQGSVQYDTPPLLGDAYLSFRFDANYRSSYYPSVSSPVQNFACPAGFTDPVTAGIPQSGNNCARIPAELLALYGLPNTAAGVNQYAALIDRQSAVGGFWLANARVSIIDIPMGGSKARLSGWVKNLLGNDTGKSYTAPFGLAVMSNFVEKRSYGLDLGISF